MDDDGAGENRDFRNWSATDLLETGNKAIEPCELWCVDYLQRHDVLPGPGSFGDCDAVNKKGLRCGGPLGQYTKRGGHRGGRSTTVFIRCARKYCQTYRSLRDSNSFLSSYDKDEKCRNGLSLSKIVTIVWCWVCDVPGRTACRFASRSHHTVLDWYRRCRSVAAHHYDRERGKLGGGRHGYVKVDITPFNVNDDGDDGPWIFGLCGANETDDATEWRYFYVRTQDERALQAIITEEVHPGTVIYSDGILELGDLLELGYFHATRGDQDQEDRAAAAGDFAALKALWREHKERYGIRYDGRYDKKSVIDKLKTVWWRSVFADKSKKELFDIFWDHVNSKVLCDFTAEQRRCRRTIRSRRLRRQYTRKVSNAA